MLFWHFEHIYMISYWYFFVAWVSDRHQQCLLRMIWTIIMICHDSQLSCLLNPSLNVFNRKMLLRSFVVAIFRCSSCKVCLSDWYFERDGRLFCRDDYWSKFGESCNRCGHVITGPVMVSSNLRLQLI